jgi:hypothetical protein
MAQNEIIQMLQQAVRDGRPPQVGGRVEIPKGLLNVMDRRLKKEGVQRQREVSRPMIGI